MSVLLVVLACKSLHVCTVCIWCCEHARFCVEVFYALYMFIHSFIHVVDLEAVVLTAAEVHITLFIFHGHFSLFEGVVSVRHTWVLSFVVLVSCIAHLTDMIFALISHRAVVHLIQTWVVVFGFGAWSANWGLLHIVTLNQFICQV